MTFAFLSPSPRTRLSLMHGMLGQYLFLPGNMSRTNNVHAQYLSTCKAKIGTLHQKIGCCVYLGVSDRSQAP